MKLPLINNRTVYILNLHQIFILCLILVVRCDVTSNVVFGQEESGWVVENEFLQKNDRRCSFSFNAGMLGAFTTLYVPENFSNPSFGWRKTHAFKPIPFLNFKAEFKKTTLRLEQLTTIPNFGFERLIDLNPKLDRKIYLVFDITPASRFYHEFWESQIGTGLGCILQQRKWTYGLVATTFLRGESRFKWYKYGLLDTSWIRLNISRQIVRF